MYSLINRIFDMLFFSYNKIHKCNWVHHFSGGCEEIRGQEEGWGSGVCACNKKRKLIFNKSYILLQIHGLSVCQPVNSIHSSESSYHKCMANLNLQQRFQFYWFNNRREVRGGHKGEWQRQNKEPRVLHSPFITKCLCMPDQPKEKQEGKLRSCTRARFSTRKENKSYSSLKSHVEGDRSSWREWQGQDLNWNHVTNTVHRAPYKILRQRNCRGDTVGNQHPSNSLSLYSPTSAYIIKLYPEIHFSSLSSILPISLSKTNKNPNT